MSSGDTKRDLVERWFVDLFNRGELDVADEILHEDVEYHGPASLSPGDVTGPEEIKRYVEVYQTAFPDLQYTVHDVSSEGNELRIRWTATGTHESDLFGLEPTGEAFNVDGLDVFVVEDGKIARIDAHWDTLKMARELEVVPPVGVLSE